MRSWRRLELNAEQPTAASDAQAPMAVLQQRLGYVFATPQLLRLALTHKSAGADNFERFEFLGDAALGYMIGRLLFDATASRFRTAAHAECAPISSTPRRWPKWLDSLILARSCSLASANAAPAAQTVRPSWRML